MNPEPKRRYQKVSKEKSEGATYTPRLLADFVANEMIQAAGATLDKAVLNIFDPAFGDGQLLESLLEHLPHRAGQIINVYGYETNKVALNNTVATLTAKHPGVVLHLQFADFLDHVLECYQTTCQATLFGQDSPLKYDLIIANPPYVRTQILGADKAKVLAKEFGLVGRVDLYYAFIVAMSKVLEPSGVSGIIVSNRFMTTKSGAAVRKAIFDQYNLMKVWDFGDTKLFEAAVLPAVLLAHGINGIAHVEPVFTSIYQCTEVPDAKAANPIEALTTNGVVALEDGRVFKVQHGVLDAVSSHDSVWRIATTTNNAWLDTVKANTWKTFGDIGKIRVGVKTTADKVFIRSDWEAATGGHLPELLRPLITHHVARSFRPLPPKKDTKILYTHEVVDGNRRCIDITQHPNSESYLLEHKTALEGRTYVIKAGRKWYEVWVPQDPAAWDFPKLVFRDISEKPTFWVDDSGAVVNGDCYWLVVQGDNADLVWLAAAVANSTFIESFYDNSFNNKLYAGRRRYITQYVEKFPLPAINTPLSEEIILLARRIYNEIDSPDVDMLRHQLDTLVWRIFGLDTEEVAR